MAFCTVIKGLTYGGLILSNSCKSVLVLEIFSNLITFLKKNKIKKLIYKVIPHIYHKLPAEEDLYALFRNNAKIFRRDVSSVIYKDCKIKFDRSRKRGVKNAIKSKVIVKETDDFHSMYNIIKDVLGSRFNKSPVHSAAEMKLLSQKFPNEIKSYACYHEEDMVTCAYIYITDSVVHAQYVYASEKGRELDSNNLMYDFLINNEFINKKYFDFGISTEDEGLYLNEGLICQKEMFGGRSVVYDQYELYIS